MKEKILKVSALAASAVMALGLVATAIPTIQRTAEAATEETVVYEQDFSSNPTDLNGLSVTDGVARPAPGNDGNAVWEYRFADGEAVPSNNYELSFDVRMDATTNNTYMFVHFLELAGGNGHVYMSIEQNGAWVCECTTLGGAATTGTGAPTNWLHGSIAQTSPQIINDEYLHVRYVHYNGIIEVWIDDVRYLVQSLQNIGNNVWGERKAIPENPIDGFMFHFQGVSAADPAYYLDNVVMKEIEELEDITYTETVEASESQSKIFGNEIATAQLGKNSYSVTAEYEVASMPTTPETAKIELCGLNGLAPSSANGDNYTVTFVAELCNGEIIPMLNWFDGGLKNYTATAIPFTGEELVLKTEVLGPKLVCSINGEVVIEGDFVKTFGIYKGDLQVVSLVNSTNMAWTSILYEEGEEVVYEVSLESSQRVATKGEEITFTATYLPENVVPASIVWYVNDQVVAGETGLTYAMTQSETGTYKVVCVIDGVESNSNFVVVKDQTTGGNGGGGNTQDGNTQGDGNEGGGQGEESGCGSVIGVLPVAGVGVLSVAAACLFRRRK